MIWLKWDIAFVFQDLSQQNSEEMIRASDSII